MNSTYSCDFCGSQNKIQMYVSKCEQCNVTFMTSDNRNDTWILFNISYYFKPAHPDYYSLNMDLKSKSTTIWFHPVGMNMRRMDIPQLFPMPHPKDALKLVDRIVKMKMFL